MGKKQHQKDRLFLTAKEWKEEWGGYKDRKSVKLERLPFYCCSLSFTPFEDPVCTGDGTVYEITNIVPYINKYHSDPVSGKPLQLEDLIPITFHKNGEEEFECPVMKKVFTQFSHIVAIKSSGNVFSYDAVNKFNIKLKSWNDLLTDEPFTKADIIHIQRPHGAADRSTGDFDHVVRNLTVENEDDSVIRNSNHTLDKVLASMSKNSGPKPSTRRELAVAQLEAALRQRRLAKSSTAKQALGVGKSGDVKPGGADADEESDGELDWRLQGPSAKPPSLMFKPGTSTWDTDDAFEQKRKAPRLTEDEAKLLSAAPEVKGPKPSEWWNKEYLPVFEDTIETVGHTARSITSTTAPVATKNERIRKLKYRCPKENGYLTLATSKGPLNIELRCDLAPRACENFLVLCEMGYYTGTTFHRSIRNFMVQGGDPTGTGKGGESIYGPTFKDEMDSRLTHSGRGVIGMANSGKDTNASQFYILYKSARHLDFKHTVFGTVVGGLETVSNIEAVPTDDDDQPIEKIEITGCTIFKNPFREMMEEEQKEKEMVAAKDTEVRMKWFSDPKSETAAPVIKQKPEGAGLEIGGIALHQRDSVKGPKKKQKEALLDEFDAW